MTYFFRILCISLFVFSVSCTSDDESIDEASEITDSNTSGEEVEEDEENKIDTALHLAFSEFSSAINIVLIDDATISIETDGLPNHTSPYWEKTNALYVAPTVADPNFMSPGNIEALEDTYELQVSTSPQKAATTTATSLGSIGIAVTGGVIYNQNEAGNVQIEENTAAGLDYSGAHTGPSGYHYHFEPTAVSDDDDNLVGIIADGFFIYGRKCFSTATYPTDLDASNGHTSITQHNDEGEYHYHIGNTTIYNEYYVNFTGDYQGTPYGVTGGGGGGQMGPR